MMLDPDGVSCRLLSAVDALPRTAGEIARRARLSHPQACTSLPRLDRSGDVVRHPGRPARYTLTPRGELRLRASAARLEAALARTLLLLSGEPRAAGALSRQGGLSRFAFYQAARELEGLGLAVRSGARGAYAYALTELGAAALEEARGVMAYAELVEERVAAD